MVNEHAVSDLDPEVTYRQNSDCRFVPSPWMTYSNLSSLVVGGKTQGFYCGHQCESGELTEFGTEIRSLPAEMFNHQLKALDVLDNSDLMGFMKSYGMLFHPSRDSRRLIEAYNCGLAKTFDKAVCGDFGAAREAAEETTHEVIQVYGQRLTRDSFLRHTYLLMMAELTEIGNSVDDLSGRVFKFNLVSIEEVRECVNASLRAARVFSAMVQTPDAREAVVLLGGDERTYGDFANTAEDAAVFINECLGGISPRIDIFANEGDFKYCPTRQGDSELGSLMQAIGLQIWEFALDARSNHSVCQECGNVFVVRQSSRSKTTKSGGMYCCDRCKNRAAQRRFRESPGYKLKRSKSTVIQH